MAAAPPHPPGPRRPGEGARFLVCFGLGLTRLAGLDEDVRETGVRDNSKSFDLRKRKHSVSIGSGGQVWG